MKKILIVVDMQNDFIDGALGTEEARAIYPKVVEYVKNFEGPVIATLDTHYEDYLDTVEGRHLPVAHCIGGTKGWRYPDELIMAIESHDIRRWIIKETFGAVKLPEAINDIMLECSGGEEVPYDEYMIEFIGVCTDICVVSNALLTKATFPDTEMAVLADKCAGVTPEKHNAAIEVLRSCQFTIL